jgi:methylmalonyl-CoA mutase N-terminal domain/subunit
VTDTVDPFAGSYFVEALTDEIEDRALALIAAVDEQGGAVAAIDFIAAEIDESAWSYQERYRTGQDTVVAVNAYTEDEEPPIATLRVDPAAEADQIARLQAFKAARDPGPLAAALEALRETAQGTGNLLHPIREALRAGATIGETAGTMRDVFGTHKPR